MVEIVHSEVTMGAGVETQTFNIPWAVLTPSNKNKVKVEFNESLYTLRGSSQHTLYWDVINPTQFTLTRVAISGAFIAATYKYSALQNE